MSKRSDAENLLRAYALKRFSARGEAPFKTQLRLHEAFERTLGRLREKYAGLDLESPRFWDDLERRAVSWWESRVVRGPGVDW